jgi:hypothetical protein
MSDLTDLLDDVLYAHRSRIGTHYETCYLDHVACLASLIRDRLDNAAVRSNN